MKDKRVAIICNYKLFPERIGGMDRFYVGFDARLKANGNTVDWFFTGYTGFTFYSDLNIRSATNDNVQQLFLEHLKSSSQEYDVVITHFVELCTKFFKAIKSLGNPQVIAVDHNPRPLEGFPLKKRIINRIKGFIYQRYTDKFIAVSHYTKRHILNDYGAFLDRKTVVVHNGIDTKIFKKRSAENRNRFIVASHLRPSKGIQDLVQAVTILPKPIQEDLLIDIYGEGPLEAELRTQVKAHDLEECIHFNGSSPELHNKFQNYAYMLQPTYMECFSLSILESLSANVPVITTQVGGNLEIIEHGKNGFIFQAGDIPSLAKIIQDICEGRIGISDKVNHRIEKEFNLDTMIEGHLKQLPCI